MIRRPPKPTLTHTLCPHPLYFPAQTLHRLYQGQPAMSEETSGGDKGERIAKRLARAGLCSRRDAERWIEEGRVSVNGKKLSTPAFVVGPADRIVVDGKPVGGPEKTRLDRKSTRLNSSH